MVTLGDLGRVGRALGEPYRGFVVGLAQGSTHPTGRPLLIAGLLVRSRESSFQSADEAGVAKQGLESAQNERLAGKTRLAASSRIGI